MRNIWAIVVGIVFVGGIGVTLSEFVGGDDPPPRPPPVVTADAGSQMTPLPSGNVGEIKIADDDLVMGRKDAPVTVVEYASLTCPHCARFHTEVLPTLKTEFVDTGKVRLVYRDFPLDQLALTAAMVAHCAGRDAFFGFIDTFYAAQSGWSRANNPLVALARMARLGGMGQDDFDACLKNQAVADKIIEQRLEGEKTFGVNATPTLFVNGDKYSGGLTLEQFRAVVAPMLNKS
jgi:protein-disulfide isomerase